MEAIKLVQKIGDEVCENCSDESDCGIKPEECPRIHNAIALLKEYLINHA